MRGETASANIVFDGHPSGGIYTCPLYSSVVVYFIGFVLYLRHVRIMYKRCFQTGGAAI